jgi:putative hydrolase of the HAD superfamily
MSPILIFDLDDTLYSERTYVESGFQAVATYLQKQRGWPVGDNVAYMKYVLRNEGRGFVFNRLLERHGDTRRSSVADCLKVYRRHLPDIKLLDSARNLLNGLSPPLYIVTDGNKFVQQNKIHALGIEPLFSKVFVTHRYGIRNAKPSVHCFGLIQRRECCDWSSMVYVGDNPSKDFVNLNPLGVHTVRVLTGEHRSVVAKPGYDASFAIETLDHLPDILDTITTVRLKCR